MKLTYTRSRNDAIKGQRKQVNGYGPKRLSNTNIDESDFDERMNRQTIEQYQFQSCSFNKVKNQEAIQRRGLATPYTAANRKFKEL